MSTKETKDATAGAPATAAAGGVRKQLAGWVSEKFKNSQDKVKAASGIEEMTSVLNDYNLVFNGALGALEAIGVSEADIQPLIKVLELNDADLTAAEKRLQLEQELAA